MIRPILLGSVFSLFILSACSGGAFNKDTISPTNRPPDPAPGGTVKALTRDKKPRPNEDPSATPQASAPRPAGENSEFSVMMNADGSISEFRRFKDHPQIIKAELRWATPSDKVLSVELKGGKSLKSNVADTFNLRDATSQEIITAGKSAAADHKADRPRVVQGK